MVLRKLDKFNSPFIKKAIKHISLFSFFLFAFPLFSTNVYANCSGYTYIEDTNPNLKYTGNWTLDNNSVYGGTNSHAGSHSYTDSGSVEFTFTGTEIQFYGKTGPGAGTANIYLDNMTRPVKTIDQYTNDHTYQILWYQNTGLSNSEHTIKVSTYDKNPSSTGTYLNVDYFVYQTCSSSTDASVSPKVPVTGVDWPTMFLFGIGALVFIGSAYLLI